MKKQFSLKEFGKAMLALILYSIASMVVLSIWTPFVFAFVQFEIKMWNWIALLFG